MNITLPESAEHGRWRLVDWHEFAFAPEDALTFKTTLRIGEQLSVQLFIADRLQVGAAV